MATSAMAAGSREMPNRCGRSPTPRHHVSWEVGQGNPPGGTDGYGVQPVGVQQVGVQQEEAVGELSSAGEAVKGEAVGADVPAGGDLVDHGQEDQVEADVLVGDELVAVQVVGVVDACGEERAHRRGVGPFGVPLKGGQVERGVTVRTVD
jgi:hypothetical protein